MASFEYCPPDFEWSEKASVVAANFVIASVFFFQIAIWNKEKIKHIWPQHIFTSTAQVRTSSLMPAD